MAQERSLTPEKQLLRLIEDSKAKSGPHIQAQAIRYHGQSLFAPGAWLGRMSFLKEKFKELTHAERSYVDIVKAINVGLVVLIAFLSLYFISSLVVSIANQKKTAHLAPAPAAGALNRQDKGVVSSALQPLSYYVDKIQSRNIFQMGAKKVAGLEETASDLSKITELTKNLKLVGISWSESPDAMIEDTKMKRTFFVKKIQMIGEVQVKDIAKDKVVLTYQGEDVELR